MTGRSINFTEIDYSKQIKYAGLVLFLIATVFTIGHHASDEHYQILEFAQYKLGYRTAEGLPWEFTERMRPTLQPWMAYFSIKAFHSIGINDPFFITFLFRLASALLAWYTISKLNLLLAKKYFTEPRWKNIFYGCTYLLWFVPYISVRFSSENFAGIFLLAGVYFLLKENIRERQSIFAGICLGLAVLFRYQLGVAVLGIAAWLLFIERLAIPKLLLTGCSLLLVMLFGLWLDYLFYNELVFTTVNYFKLNLIEGRASDFGVRPVWFYFTYFILVGIPPLAMILFLSFFYGIWKLPKGLWTFLIIPFVLIHIFIPHKEIRFLFPVFYPFIFLAVYGLKAWFAARQIKRIHRRLFRIGIALNLVVLAFRIFLPANEKINYYRYLYYNHDLGNSLVLTTEKNTYELVGNLRATFYEHPNTRSLHFDSLLLLQQYLETNKVIKCFVLQRTYAPITLPGYSMQKVYSIYPALLKKIGSYDIEKRVKPWSIYVASKK